MTLWRQTHLGFSYAKTLTLIDLVLPSSKSHDGSGMAIESTTAQYLKVEGGSAGKPFIFLLPDELLLSIVEFAVIAPGLRMHLTIDCRTGIVLTLSRVCRKLRRLAQPLLFRNICIASPNRIVPPSISVIKLHRTLRERADLRQHCRFLHLYISDVRRSPTDSFHFANDFAKWLKGTRLFSIHGGFEYNGFRSGPHHTTWDLIRQIAANFEDLEEVHISREGWGLYLPHILNWLGCPRLKTLHISGISKWKQGSVELDPEKRRTATFTSLHISDYEERPEATSLLLQWPAVLTSFKFDSFYSNPHVMDYPMFESWLLIHRDSLTHVDIGYLSRGGSDRLFNATLFPNLEYLSLSRWQMPRPVQFSLEDSNILGPKLKTFTWSFSIFDQHNESWCDFGEAEANWVRELAEIAGSRKAALATIKIVFEPDYYWNTTEEMGYPWDRMDSLRDQTFKPNGLELVYSKPPISKSEWLEHVRTRILESGPEEAASVIAAGEERSIASSEAEEAELLEAELHGGYQGEDIRGYFNIL